MKSNRYFYIRAVFVHITEKRGPAREFAILTSDPGRNCALLTIKGIPNTVHSNADHRFYKIGKIVAV